MIKNVVIGKLLIPEWQLFALDEKDFEIYEKEFMYYTNETFLPKILVDLKIFPSISEIRRNRKDLIRDLKYYSYEEIKIGKKHKIYIGVGKGE